MKNPMPLSQNSTENTLIDLDFYNHLLIIQMRSQNQKIHGYVELKNMGNKAPSRLDKFADNISGKMKALKDLKNRIVNQSHPELKDTNNFKKEIRGFEAIIKEFYEIEPENEADKGLKERTIKGANEFLQDLHPQQVQQKIVRVQKDLTQSIQLKQQKQIMLSPLERQQLQNDKQYLKQIHAAVQVAKDMVHEIANLVHDQKQHLTIAASNMVSARSKIGDAKKNVIQGVGYEQDTNKRTYMCCILITVIVLLILMVVYATHK